MTFLLAAALLSPPKTLDTWQTLKPAGARFTVSIPGKPTTQKEDAPLPTGGNVRMTRYLVSSGQNFYMVQDAYLPPNVYSQVAAAPDTMLDSIVASFGTGMGGKKISSATIKFQGYPGRSMMFERSGTRVKGITVLVGDHNYTVVFGGTPEEMEGPNSKKFFGSFKILKK